METFGVHKRDILVDRVQDGREAQEDARKQFQTTFEAFKSLTGFNGGSLESTYNKLKSGHERASDRAATVASKIKSMDRVAQDLFSEWKTEIGTYQGADLRAKSTDLLRETQERYGRLIAAMRAAEARMPPVLAKFNDHVLFLKHNLNAKAIASLQDTVVQIGGDVDHLIGEMQRSIDEADQFITAMKNG